MINQPEQARSTSLAGAFRLSLGVPQSVTGQRSVLGGGRLGRLLRGQQGEGVVRTLGNVFTLCAHAHRRTARLALRAASPKACSDLPVDSQELLQLETARDHLRCMALDWPHRQVARQSGPQGMRWLEGCPLTLTASPLVCSPSEASVMLGSLRDWLERLLNQSVQEWLSHHRESSTFALWCRSRAEDLSPARCLADWYPLGSSMTPPIRCLNLLHTDAAEQHARMRDIARAMASDPDYVQRPLWNGLCAETGVWTRFRHQDSRDWSVHTAWTRLGARWWELLEIAAASTIADRPEAPPLLNSGALALGDGQAIAWCEMARGLLLHWVQMDSLGAVKDYRVLAPTEWNFHPDGALARALTALPPHATAAAHCLTAAYDPCVDCVIVNTAVAQAEHA